MQTKPSRRETFLLKLLGIRLSRFLNPLLALYNQITDKTCTYGKHSPTRMLKSPISIQHTLSFIGIRLFGTFYFQSCVDIANEKPFSQLFFNRRFQHTLKILMFIFINWLQIFLLRFVFKAVRVDIQTSVNIRDQRTNILKV